MTSQHSRIRPQCVKKSLKDKYGISERKRDRKKERERHVKAITLYSMCCICIDRERERAREKERKGVCGSSMHTFRLRDSDITDSLFCCGYDIFKKQHLPCVQLFIQRFPLPEKRWRFWVRVSSLFDQLLTAC